MAYLTFTLASNTTDITLTLPVNSSLVGYKIQRLLGCINDNGATGRNWRYGISNVRSYGVTSLASFSNPGVLLTQGSDIRFIEDERLLCPSDAITTIHCQCSTAATISLYVWYQQIPRGI